MFEGQNDGLEKHELMDGKLHVYKRKESNIWQCSTYLRGRNHRQSTKEENLFLAKEFAKLWYMERYVESRSGRVRQPSRPFIQADHESADLFVSAPLPSKSTRTFREAADKFLAEYQIITEGERSESYIKSHQRRLNLHLLPYFGERPLAEINAGLVQEYRIHRRQSVSNRGKPPSRSQLHHETVTLRLVLKAAHRHRWISQVPDISPPYKTSGKIKHRAWFTREEYKRLYKATRERAKNPKRERWRKNWETLHDYVLFMVNTGLRPDEASRLQYRDVAEVLDQSTEERILEIEVRGKRGIGYCKSMPGAVLPFRRMRQRYKPEPTDRIFDNTLSGLLNKILEELDLKFDRDGQVRTAYSLRHTYICLRLLEGADIYQVAKNCRTSVEMIQEFYAAHLKNTLDASAINVRKDRTKRGRSNTSETKP